jgi:hypothetical protein
VAIPETTPTLANFRGTGVSLSGAGLLLRSFLPDQKLVDQKIERFQKE